MVDPHQVMLGAIAVSILIIVPILSVLAYDLVVGRWDDRLARLRDSRPIVQLRENHRDLRQRRENVQALRNVGGASIQTLVSDLRRLRARVLNDSGQSAIHQIGNRMAYDGLLVQVCDMLEIHHDLNAHTSGLDRDIERVRVEALLEDTGIVLVEPRYGQAA